MNKITKTRLCVLLGIEIKNSEDKAILRVLINEISIDEICKSLSSISDDESATFITGLSNAIYAAKGEISNPLLLMLLNPAEEEIQKLNSAKDVIFYYIERGKTIYLGAGMKQGQGTVVRYHRDFSHENN